MRLRDSASRPAPIFLLLVFACLSILALTRMPRLRLTVRPQAQLYSAQSKVTVELHVKRRAENRAVSIAVFCDGEYEAGSDQIPHVGEDAHPVVPRTYPRVGPGECEAIGTLYATDGTFTSRAPFQVLSLQ